ncbi:hypothetical protein [Desulfocurvus sp. DL9XJH121]
MHRIYIAVAVLEDDDLDSVRGEPWFRDILDQVCAKEAQRD